MGHTEMTELKEVTAFEKNVRGNYLECSKEIRNQNLKETDITRVWKK